MRYYITVSKNTQSSIVVINDISLTAHSKISFLPMDSLTMPANKLVRSIDDLENSIITPSLVQFTPAQLSVITKRLDQYQFDDISYHDPDQLVDAYRNANKASEFTANELADHILYLASTHNKRLTSLQLSMSMFATIVQLTDTLSQETLDRFNSLEQFHDTPYGPKLDHISKRFAIYSGNPILDSGSQNDFLTKYDAAILASIEFCQTDNISIFDRIRQYHLAKNNQTAYTIENQLIHFN